MTMRCNVLLPCDGRQLVKNGFRTIFFSHAFIAVDDLVVGTSPGKGTIQPTAKMGWIV